MTTCLGHGAIPTRHLLFKLVQDLTSYVLNLGICCGSCITTFGMYAINLPPTSHLNK